MTFKTAGNTIKPLIGTSSTGKPHLGRLLFTCSLKSQTVTQMITGRLRIGYLGKSGRGFFGHGEILNLRTRNNKKGHILMTVFKKKYLLYLCTVPAN